VILPQRPVECALTATIATILPIPPFVILELALFLPVVSIAIVGTLPDPPVLGIRLQMVSLLHVPLIAWMTMLVLISSDARSVIQQDQSNA
jgi:hypothetical protein